MIYCVKLLIEVTLHYLKNSKGNTTNYSLDHELNIIVKSFIFYFLSCQVLCKLSESINYFQKSGVVQFDLVDKIFKRH